MSDNFLLNSELSPSSLLLPRPGSIDELSQSAAYGLSTGLNDPGLGGSLGLDDLSWQSPLEPEAAILASPSLASASAVVNETPSNATADALTGISAGEAVVLDISGSSESVQQVFGRLDYSDYFNPTRLYAYKDDYLLTTATSTTVQINLDSYDIDAYLQLVDVHTGSVLAFDDDGGSDNNSQLSFVTQAGSEYLIRATSYDSFEVGAYSLTAYLGTGNPPPSTPPNEFDPASGYGLVDAAAAVARATGAQPFDSVPDIGGNEWNNDLVNAPEVWAQGYTGRGVTVAVIDSGVDINHEDLRDNIWVNADEILGDGIDNDGNGYSDDRFGWNFGIGQSNNNVLPGTNDPGQSHGTHVAGTIAAANNGLGMTGVAHGANIMAIRMGDVDNNRFVNGGSLAQAIRYAVDNGAQVINMSLGWSDEGGAVGNALAYAAERNVITVSAAGNQGNPSPDSAPGSYATDYGVVVGAVNSQRNLADFSNRAGNDNRMQYVTAPGVDIYSTVSDPTRYDFNSGTSMAAPHVAGVVALMLSANPNLTHAEVRTILTSTTASRSGQSVEDSVDPSVESDIAPNYPPDLIGPSSLGNAMIERSGFSERSTTLPRAEFARAAAALADGAADLTAEGEMPAVQDWPTRLAYSGEYQPAPWAGDLVFPLQEAWLEEALVKAIA